MTLHSATHGGDGHGSLGSSLPSLGSLKRVRFEVINELPEGFDRARATLILSSYREEYNQDNLNEGLSWSQVSPELLKMSGDCEAIYETYEREGEERFFRVNVSFFLNNCFNTNYRFSNSRVFDVTQLPVEGCKFTIRIQPDAQSSLGLACEINASPRSENEQAS